MIEFDKRFDKRLEERTRLSVELAENIRELGPELSDSLPLNVLFRWCDPQYLTPIEQKTYHVPGWRELQQKLNPPEKAMVTKALGAAYRAGILTLGELRAMDEPTLATRSTPATKCPVGQSAARFLKMSFPPI